MKEEDLVMIKLQLYRTCLANSYCIRKLFAKMSFSRFLLIAKCVAVNRQRNEDNKRFVAYC